MNIEKSNVEELLGQSITDEMFLIALDYAKAKQQYIFQTTGRDIVLSDWYLEILTKEYVISLEFHRFTASLCRLLSNDEKKAALEG